MSTYDKRLDLVEKDVSTMKHDIIYKIDDTNSAVTMLRGVMSTQGRDIKFLINQVKGIDIRLEGLDQEVRTIREQQDGQGQDIRELKHNLDSLEKSFNNRLDGVEKGLNNRLDVVEKKLDDMMSMLSALVHKPD